MGNFKIPVIRFESSRRNVDIKYNYNAVISISSHTFYFLLESKQWRAKIKHVLERELKIIKHGEQKHL